MGKKGYGYAFAAFDPENPYLALGRVRGKIRRALATRFLHKDGSLTHDEVRGRITYLRDEDDVGLVIDGKSMTIYEFAQLLRGLEGFEFELRLVEALE